MIRRRRRMRSPFPSSSFLPRNSRRLGKERRYIRTWMRACICAWITPGARDCFDFSHRAAASFILPRPCGRQGGRGRKRARGQLKASILLLAPRARASIRSAVDTSSVILYTDAWECASARVCSIFSRRHSSFSSMNDFSQWARSEIEREKEREITSGSLYNGSLIML